jgi:hypothetical protein
MAGVASRPVALRQPHDDVAVALAGATQRLELGQDARIEPDTHAAILGALRLKQRPIRAPAWRRSALASGSPRATRIVATASDRRPFHDDESGALQMSDNAIGYNRSHVFI